MAYTVVVAMLADLFLSTALSWQYKYRAAYSPIYLNASIIFLS